MMMMKLYMYKLVICRFERDLGSLKDNIKRFNYTPVNAYLSKTFFCNK